MTQEFKEGDRVRFYPKKGEPRLGTVIGWRVVKGKIGVLLDGDPFGPVLPVSQLEKIKTRRNIKDSKSRRRKGEKMAAGVKELRKRAKELGIDGYEEMTRAELQAAVDATDDEEQEAVVATKTKKGKKDKDKVKKGKAVKGESNGKVKKEFKGGTKGNPFKPGSNQFVIAERLIKGGKRSDMVDDLREKLHLRPREAGGHLKGRDRKDFDTITIDGRIKTTAKKLENEYGWKVTRDGRGMDATIKAKPPKS